MGRLTPLLAAVFVAAAATSAPGAPGEAPPPKVEAAAWDAMAHGATAEILVVMTTQADLEPASALRDLQARRRFVHDTLLATSESTQGPVRQLLARAGAPMRPFISVNALWTRADRALARTLASRADVARIEANPHVHVDLGQRLATPPSVARPKGIAGVEWGVDRTNAPQVWALGHSGEGIVVGGQDTGVRWTHENLVDHYRGWDGTTASHDYNWHDSIHGTGTNPCGYDLTEPCDDFGHGSHTMGIAVGGTAADQTGVAPGAKWIACRNMDAGTGSPATYLECFDFFLGPYPVGGTPADGRPDLAPDVTVNSWLCPPSEGCVEDTLQAAVEAQRAAGIETVAAAGNDGPGCATIASPPGVYAASFTVGATDSTDAVAGFSSRGPAGTAALMKPDVVAPGDTINSCISTDDTSYAAWSGTSMATPHVAGVVALLWSGWPEYRTDLDATEDLLRRTARRLPAVVESCGGDYVTGPNDTWGDGLVDVSAAYASACWPQQESNCSNGFDDDCDGAADCADQDCAGNPACPEAGNCADGIDNDRNGLADCQDPACQGDPACPESANCTDQVDNDGDGLVDCADPDCAGNPACPERGHCTDGVDNDLDGLVDCADPDCSDPACAEAGHCADGRDNDGDGLVDCADPDCAGDPACPEAGNCHDGVDNDRDGLVDCADPDCVGDPGCPEAGNCHDGLDNDGDTLVDCADPDCDGSPDCPEAGNCTDGRDNDLDGLTDCLDPDCVFTPACDQADSDGDTVPNAQDCLVVDPSAFAVPPELSPILVRRGTGPDEAIVDWPDPRPLAGVGSTAEIASGDLGALRRTGSASGACAAVGLASPGWTDGGVLPRATGRWYLVRAVNACGPGPHAQWGTTSTGLPEPGCR